MTKRCAYCRRDVSDASGFYELRRREYGLVRVALVLCTACGGEVVALGERPECGRCHATTCLGCPVATEKREARPVGA